MFVFYRAQMWRRGGERAQVLRADDPAGARKVFQPLANRLCERRRFRGLSRQGTLYILNVNVNYRCFHYLTGFK